MTAQILEGPKSKYPIEHKSMGHFFFDYCTKYSDRICQIDAFCNKSETYSSVKLRSIRLALSLQKLGISSQDVITLCTPNTLDNTIAMISGSFLGAKISNLDSSLSLRHINHLLSLVAPKIIFVDEDAIKIIEESLMVTDLNPKIVVFGHSDKYTTFDELVHPQENEKNFYPYEVDIDDGSVLLFSSGTTGLPKAIYHSHRSFLYVINNEYQAGWCGHSFHSTTFYWITAYMIFCSTIKDGSCRIFSRKADIEDIYRIIQQHKVEFTFMAPILAYKFVIFENAHKYDTSSLRLLGIGGTPIAPSQMEKVKASLKASLVYGMSEIGVISIFDLRVDEEESKKKITSSGRLVPNLRLKIVDSNTGNLLGPNQKGEIHLFSPSLMKGYYKGDASEVFDEDGFLKTGDIGYYDEDNCIYIVDRIKEMFKYLSWHIVPSAIEAVLVEHPSIKEALVFGVPRGLEGEVPAAAIILKDNCKVSASDIENFLEDKVADREKLRGGIMFVKSFPVTPTGKINRKHVRSSLLNL